jgi:UDP-N-acetylglucosamine 2-epimerase (non-hydrolysing)
MPEEINRLVTDSITDLFLVTEESGCRNLIREGADPARVHLVGNLMIDSLKQNLEQARQSGIIARLNLPERFGLVTLHRPANVDEPGQLGTILEALTEIAATVPLCWPVHPRARERLTKSGISLPAQLTLVEPLGYLDFLCLEAAASVVLTDSGGIQEETTVLGVPCLTIRENTERPATIDCGTNRLAGISKDTILAAWREHLAAPKTSSRVPFWDGQAGQRCHAVLRHYFLESPVPGPAE